jgi:hypothetical protein
MRMLVAFLLAAIIAPGGSSNTANSAPDTSDLHDESYVVSASVSDLAKGYLGWQQQHADAAQAGKALKFRMPSIDLYSPSGVSIHHGENSDTNAAFLRSLPNGLNDAAVGGPRPSLKEIIEMFSELKSQEGSLLAAKSYTIFAITYPFEEFCKAQNEAVEKLRERKMKIRMRIIEVRLHK